MISKIDKNADRKIRHVRVRKKVKGTAQKPRLNVYRSNRHIYVQFIDDVKGVTYVSASTLDGEIGEKVKDVNKNDAAKIVGAEAAKRALAKGITEVVFDRSGYIYTGRVEKVAEGAREAGLKF
ncbi:MAG: 50S ribosomal protein L18 [Clostridiales bacterium]|jgi:large subunit ribosomal protein L18|nr:50S ribosomal protein L18 [Clostridiales bacterium]